MARRRTTPPLRSGGYLWGPRRVRAGVSIVELGQRSGVSIGLLSLMEHGRLIPTSEEYDRVRAALDSLEAEVAQAVT